jgi:nitrogen fixation NifU-like protein
MTIENIFSEILLDHSKHPRNYGAIDDAHHTIEGANPLCGDEIEIQVKTEGSKIIHIGFTGRSCAVCTASTSMFCEIAEGKSFEALDRQKELFYKLLHGEEMSDEEKETLGEALSLTGVAKLPARVKCATLAYETWSVLKKRLEGDADTPATATSE